jgi:two-component system sensor histidine kinase AlgZ
MWPIVRDALADASPAVRMQLRWMGLLWAGMVALQIWDSRNAAGPAGAAELLSALLGVSGVALLGTAHSLQRTIGESAARRSLRADHDSAALQQVLIALPALGFASGVALGAAAALVVLRALLGAELFLMVTSITVYAGMLLLAASTVNNSSRTLFEHATRQAALAADARGRATAAQLAALQARMNPHFLFNALNTVASVVRSNPSAAERVVENLSDVLRQTLRRSAERTGTVGEEIDYVRAYLALEQDRWGDRLRIVWTVDDAARARPLPPLLLQPIVENAVKHGLGGRIDGGTIEIAVADGNPLRIRVEDDGPGFPSKWTEGTGLGNLRERLETLFGGRAALDVSSEANGARVVLTIPA